MKILQVNAVGQYGSTGRACRELEQYVNTYTPHCCYTAFSVGTENEFSYRIGGRLDAKIHGLLSRISGKQGHFSKIATRKLIRWIEKLKPDVVHLGNLHSNYIHFPALMKYLAHADIPTVITLHDCWFFTGKCCHYTVDGCDRWQTGCHHCPRLKKDNISWFVDATNQLWNEKKELFEAIPRLAVTGVSQWIVDEAEKSFLRCAREVIKICNWIDLDVFTPVTTAAQTRARLFPGKKYVVLGAAAVWSEAKGLREFVKLAGALGEEFAVCLVGKMPKGIANLGEVHHIPPTQSLEELAELYTMANVFVTLSAEETFGKVSAEALACGTPVVCYDSTANKELVGKGCGAVHVLGDLDGIEASVRRICRDKKEIYTDVCRSFAQRNFAKEDRIKDYLDLYHRICEK